MFSLVSFEEDWADEFRVCGFSVVHTEYVNDIRNLVKDKPNTIQEWCFGSNQSFHYTYQELFDCFKIVELSDCEAKVLDKIFMGDFGADMWGHLCEAIFDQMPEDDFREFSEKWL